MKLWKALSSIGCKVYKLGWIIMNAIVANAMIISKIILINNYFRPSITLRSNPKP